MSSSGKPGLVLVLLGWKVIAVLRDETANLDAKAAEKYVRNIQRKALEGGGE